MKFKDYSVLDEILKIPIPESYGDVFSLIKSDLFRKYGHIPSMFELLLSITNKSSLFLILFRLASYNGFGKLFF